MNQKVDPSQTAQKKEQAPNSTPIPTPTPTPTPTLTPPPPPPVYTSPVCDPEG